MATEIEAADRLVGIGQAAQIVGLEVRVVRNLLRQGRFAPRVDLAVKRNQWRVSDLTRWLADLPTK